MKHVFFVVSTWITLQLLFSGSFLFADVRHETAPSLGSSRTGTEFRRPGASTEKRQSIPPKTQTTVQRGGYLLGCRRTLGRILESSLFTPLLARLLPRHNKLDIFAQIKGILLHAAVCVCFPAVVDAWIHSRTDYIWKKNSRKGKTCLSMWPGRA